MGKYFGTDGVRGIANIKLTSRLAYRIGRYIGQYPNGKKNKILIGRDTRISGAMLDAGLISGITSSGGDVYELGITSTPCVSYLVENGDYDFGIMISASHNPFFDNGIKIFSPSGEKLSSDIEDLIEKYIDSEDDYLPLVENDQIGRVISSKNLVEQYLDYLVSKANPSIKNIKICMDCANGSASALAERLFLDKLNFEKLDIVFSDYNGLNINAGCGSTHMEKLCEIVKNGDYDLGIAFDGDADRVLFVNSSGNIVDGDALMYLNARYLKKHNLLNDNKIVITVMSNLGLKIALKEADIGYEEVTVGDKYVQACLKEKKLSLGGEQSGHIIFASDLNTGDGLLSAIKTLNVLADENLTIEELLKDLTIYPQIIKNVGVSNKDAIMQNQEIKEKIISLEASLQGKGRILVRPSGTEQLIRVMVEASSIEKCKEIADILAELINQASY